MLEQLETSHFSTLIRTELWGWPLAITLHAFGTALVVGFIFIIGLRLLGLFESIPYSALSRMFPVIWGALALQIVSGFFLWMTKPTRYVADGAFLLKLLLIIAGVVLTAKFSKVVAREAASWDMTGTASARTTRYVAVTLVVWCVVVITGRLTGYLGSI